MRSFIAGLVLLLACAPAQAQAPKQKGDDAGLRKLIAEGLDALPNLPCANRRPCAPATAQERARPPLTMAEARRIVDRGVISGAAEHCGLDWRDRNLAPLVRHLRDTLRKSDRAMALAAYLHGTMQDQTRNAFAQAGPCSEQAKRSLDARLTYRP
ncbi:MAG: hypothetical protein M5U07_15290 [Xanthobacteraceae bacterium]|nr:hypothetical protein [Xanthobacteraceae bacterium]PWB64268.1 MAG: hypothetical protein C3F17_07600 [Bradyrhizobiaceae bacterium]GIK80600.1 MAG: hypothetical protein BroJett024_17050 [Alphaproteobacteria bacterium]